ncbi:MAG: PAS domain-containing protein, partial [Pseudoxanthomonas sp.]
MTPSAAEKQPHAFMEGGGGMGERTRNFDWASTPLGAPETWPAQLKAAVRLLLSSPHPMLLWWGPQLVQFYNDAHARSIGLERHPGALGQRGRECWEEAWDLLGPQIEQVMQGHGATWNENARMPITRNGVREDVCWSYSCNPIDEPDAPHGVGGVLMMRSEANGQATAERERLEQLFQQAPGFKALLHGPQHVFKMVNSAYMKLVGNHDLLGKAVADALPGTVKQGYVDLLDEVYRNGKPFTTTGARFEFTGANQRRVERYIDFVYQPITDTQGAVTGILVEGFDVSGAHADADAVRELYDTLEQRVADAVAERNILADLVEFSDTHTLAIDLCYYVLAVNKSYSDEFESVYGHRLEVGDNLLE